MFETLISHGIEGEFKKNTPLEGMPEGYPPKTLLVADTVRKLRKVSIIDNKKLECRVDIISNVEFLQTISKGERLGSLTEPNIESSEIKQGTELNFLFTQNGIFNSDLYLNTTFGQLGIPSNVREVESGGIMRKRGEGVLEGEFFDEKNNRLTIHCKEIHPDKSGNKVIISKIATEEEMKFINDKVNKQIENYGGNSKYKNTENFGLIVSSSIKRGINPDFILGLFGSILSMVGDNEKESKLELLLTDYERHIGYEKVSKLNNIEKLSIKLALPLAKKYAPDGKWKEFLLDKGFKGQEIERENKTKIDLLGLEGDELFLNKDVYEGMYNSEKADQFFDNSDTSKKQVRDYINNISDYYGIPNSAIFSILLGEFNPAEKGDPFKAQRKNSIYIGAGQFSTGENGTWGDLYKGISLGLINREVMPNSNIPNKSGISSDVDATNPEKTIEGIAMYLLYIKTSHNGKYSWAETLARYNIGLNKNLEDLNSTHLDNNPSFKSFITSNNPTGEEILKAGELYYTQWTREALGQVIENSENRKKLALVASNMTGDFGDCGLRIKECLASINLINPNNERGHGYHWENILDKNSNFIKVKIDKPEDAIDGGILVYDRGYGKGDRFEAGHVEIKANGGYWHAGKAQGDAGGSLKNQAETGFIGYVYYPI